MKYHFSSVLQQLENEIMPSVGRKLEKMGSLSLLLEVKTGASLGEQSDSTKLNAVYVPSVT